MRLARCAVVIVVTTAAAVACGGPQVGPRVTAAPEPPASTPTAPSAAPPSGSGRTLGPAPADIRAVNWLAARLPAEFCGVEDLASFRDGEALVQSTTYGEVHLSVRDAAHPVYGDLDGDGREDAVVPISCDNNGGTASGQLAFGAVAVRATDGQLVTMGTISTQVNPADAGHVTLISKLDVDDGAVEVEETWYRPSDTTASPSGRATTRWVLEGATLVAEPPVITS